MKLFGKDSKEVKKEYNGFIGLGWLVKDKVSGFKGVTVSRTQFLYGCIRIGVQALIDKDGKIPESCCFDEPQLIVLEENYINKSIDETKDNNIKPPGGPAPYTIKNKPEIKK